MTSFNTALADQAQRVHEACERLGEVQDDNYTKVMESLLRFEAAVDTTLVEIERRRVACSIERVRAQARLRALNNGITCEAELAEIAEVAEAHLRMGSSHEASVSAAAGTRRSAA